MGMLDIDMLGIGKRDIGSSAACQPRTMLQWSFS